MAIWVTPKLSSLPDVGITGAADGEVLTYDNVTGKWVNEALPASVTDHGALTGLSDDDHSQYILVNATRGFTGSPSSPGTGTNSERFGSGATATGNDSTVIGKNASVTGNQATVIGYAAVAAAGGVSIGNQATTTQIDGITIGSGGSNAALRGILIGRGATINGTESIVIGYNADGGTGSNRNILIGSLTDCGTFSDTIALGRAAVNTASNQMMIGAHSYWVNIVQKSRPASTNSTNNFYTIDQACNTTPVAGFGAGILFQLESSTTDSQDAARIATVWSDATHATRTADIVFSTVVGAAALAEKLRLTGAGILKFSGTMGDSTKTVGTDAPADWVQIEIGANTYYIPAYAA